MGIKLSTSLERLPLEHVRRVAARMGLVPPPVPGPGGSVRRAVAVQTQDADEPPGMPARLEMSGLLGRDRSRDWGAAAGRGLPRVAIVDRDATVRLILHWIMDTGLGEDSVELLDAPTLAHACELRFGRPALDLLLLPTANPTRPMVSAIDALRKREAADGLPRVPILTRPLDPRVPVRLPDVDQLLVDPMTDEEFLAVIRGSLGLPAPAPSAAVSAP